MQADMSNILYNEYVMGDYDYYEDHDDIVVIDDSGEWYNTDGEQRSLAVLVGLISQRSWVRIPLPLLLRIGG